MDLFEMDQRRLSPLDSEVGPGWTVEALVELVLLFILMTGLGTTIEIEEFKNNFKDPKGIITCIVVQYLLVPPAAYGVALLINLDEPFAVGLLIISCCPGGALSNVFCYFFKADLAMSVSMTTASSILSMGLLPANLFLYLEATGLSNEVELDFVGIAVSALCVIVGTFLGFYFQPYEKTSIRLQKAGSISGLLLVLWGFVANLTSENKFWDEELGPLIFACLVPSLLGLALGAGASAAVGLTKQQQLALSVETSFRNKIIAIAIIGLTFDDKEEKDRAIIMPLLYGLLSFVVNTTWCLLGWKFGYTFLEDDVTAFDLFCGCCGVCFGVTEKEHEKNLRDPLVDEAAKPLDDEEARIDKLISEDRVPSSKRLHNQSSFMMSMESGEPNKRSSAVLSRSFMS